MWRPNTILMENHRKKHKTFIKITERVFSQDYVPPEMFTTDWLLKNRHISSIKDRLLNNTAGSFNMKDKDRLNNLETTDSKVE